MMRRVLLPPPVSFSKCLSLVLLFIVIGLFLPVTASAAPVTFITALPVARGEVVFRLQSKYLSSTGDPTAMNRELTVRAVPLALVYGVTPDFTLFVVAPYLDKELELDSGSGRLTRGVSGLGDATFIARYTIWKRNSPGETKRIAPFAMIKAPTGDDDAQDSLGSLPRTLQLSSGSWDYTLGVVTSLQTFKWELDGSLSYRFNTEADGFRFGDESKIDISYQHRLLPRKLASGMPYFFNAVIESSLVWKDKNEASGVVDKDSGGATWFLTPALQYATRRIIIEAGIQLPVIQELNGNGLENDFTGILSFRANF